MRTSNNQLYFIQTALLPTPNPLPTPSGTPAPTPTSTTYAKFIRSVTLPNKDLIYSGTEQKFYATVRNIAGEPRANSLTPNSDFKTVNNIC